MLETLHSKLKLTSITVISFLLAIGGSFLVVNCLYWVVQSEYNDYFGFEAAWSLTLSIVFIGVYVVGSIVVVRQSKNQDELHYYRFFFFFLILVLLVTTVFTIYLGVAMKPSEKFKTDLWNSVQLYDTKPDDELPLKLNSLQLLRDCCGFTGFQDYEYRSKRGPKLISPSSCCPTGNKKCNKQNSYPGCWPVYKESYNFFKVFHVSLLGVSIFLLVKGIVFMVIFSKMHSDA